MSLGPVCASEPLWGSLGPLKVSPTRALLECCESLKGCLERCWGTAEGGPTLTGVIEGKDRKRGLSEGPMLFGSCRGGGLKIILVPGVWLCLKLNKQFNIPLAPQRI